MLSIKGILALYDPSVPVMTALFGSLAQGAYHIEIRNGGKFDGRIFPAGSLISHRSCSHDQISALHVDVHSPAGSDADKGVRAAPHQLFHRNGCRGAADACRGHTHLLSLQHSGPGDKFPAVRNQFRRFKICRNLLTPFRISGQDHISAHISRFQLNMVLYAIFRIFHLSFPHVSAAISLSISLFCS